jgi:UDP-hydrolysing UDP-N-acetyl-D-glucosamine 2-epimerase
VTFSLIIIEEQPDDLQPLEFLVMKRKIAVVTSSRADYSHLYWPLHDLATHPAVDLQLIVMGPHLSPAFGPTVNEIERDGFPIAGRVECLLSSDTDIGMAKTIGVAVLGLADLLGRLRPDLLLLIADRYEMFAPASVALALRIPIAHIEGGEISEGAIDDAVRNALTKMSHIHFTTTRNARARVIAMGEEPWRVHRSGAPSLDHLRRSRLLTRDELEQKLAINLTQPTLLVVYHSVTLLRETTSEADALFAALNQLDEQIVFTYPNADAGSHHLIERTRAFAGTRKNTHIFLNLGAVTYLSLLRHVGAMVGNSSSGIMETASFGVPTVDIGMRQQGRERARNVLSAAPNAADILGKVREALRPDFRSSLVGMDNPYGDGHASQKIVEVLTTVPLTPELLIKRAVIEARISLRGPDSGIIAAS